jgi:hypothetical protein
MDEEIGIPTTAIAREPALHIVGTGVQLSESLLAKDPLHPPVGRIASEAFPGIGKQHVALVIR